MAQYFNFKRLIEKYSTDFTVCVPSKDDFDDSGEYVKGTPTKQTFRGAILSHRESKIFKSGGTLTEQDRALYMLEPPPADLQGAELIHGENLYHISSKLENAAFTGVYAYMLKFVSVFNGGGAND